MAIAWPAASTAPCRSGGGIVVSLPSTAPSFHPVRKFIRPIGSPERAHTPAGFLRFRIMPDEEKIGDCIFPLTFVSLWTISSMNLKKRSEMGPSESPR